MMPPVVCGPWASAVGEIQIRAHAQRTPKRHRRPTRRNEVSRPGTTKRTGAATAERGRPFDGHCTRRNLLIGRRRHKKASRRKEAAPKAWLARLQSDHVALASNAPLKLSTRGLSRSPRVAFSVVSPPLSVECAPPPPSSITVALVSSPFLSGWVVASLGRLIGWGAGWLPRIHSSARRRSA